MLAFVNIHVLVTALTSITLKIASSLQSGALLTFLSSPEVMSKEVYAFPNMTKYQVLLFRIKSFMLYINISVFIIKPFMFYIK